jgi:hypothetical protein
MTGGEGGAYFPRDLNLSVTGPARLSFWWRASGPADLQLVFNDHVLPLPPPSGGQWQHCALMVPAGAQTIKWRHTAVPALTLASTPAEAAVDEITLTPAADAALAEALGTPGRAFTATSQTGMRGWQPLAWSTDHGPLQSMIMAPAWRYEFSAHPSLSTTVAGPAVVSFRWQCRTSRADLTSTPRWQPAEFQLAVDGVPVRAIPADGHEDWVTTSHYVGPGSHEVTWQKGPLRLAPTYNFLIGHYLRDLTITTPAQHYTQWAAVHQLPPGNPSVQDSDGDGLADLMEYALGLNPRAHDAETAQLRVVPAGNDLQLFVPRPEGVLPLVVETSSDLAVWSPAFDPVPAGVPYLGDGAGFTGEQYQGIGLLPEWTRAPKRFSLPLIPGSRFFRLKVNGAAGMP